MNAASVEYPPFLLDALRRHGAHSLAYSAWQPGLSYFGDAERGVIAYSRHFGRAAVLGDPISPPEHRAALLRDFSRAFPRACFMQIHRETADALEPDSYRIVPVGVENEIDTTSYTLTGKSKCDLRHYRNRAVAGGCIVTEEPDTHALRQELKSVSDDWLPMKSWFGKELAFLARPFLLEPEPDVRIFVARIEGRAVAFTILDPMCREGRPYGYVVTILRHALGAPEGAVDYINITAIERLREEGLSVLSLGVSPFYGISRLVREEGAGSWPVYFLFQALRRFGAPIYHFAGLSFHKSRYRAREIPVYAAVRPPLGMLPMLAAARACHML